MSRKTDEPTPEPTPDTEPTPETDVRTFEHDNATAVREGVLSAAQLPGGGGNVDPANPDAQYPPGRIDNTAPMGDATADPATFVPTAKEVRSGADFTATTYKTATATPDYS